MPLIAPGKRKGNRFWLWRARIGGREYEISTQCLDKEAARRVALDLEREIRNRRPDQVSRPSTFAEAATRFRTAHGRLSGPDDGFLEKMECELGGLRLDAIVADDIVRAGRRIYPAAAAATINRQAIVPAAAVLHYAAEQGWCPYRRISRLREPEARTRAIEPAQADRLLAVVADDPLKFAFLVCLFVQGWRVSEATGLQWQRVDLPRARVERWIAKRRTWRWQALDPATVAVLANIPATDGKRAGRVFPWGHRSNVYRWLRPAAKKAEIVFTPHMARHSAATWARRAGADLQELMKAYGWESIKSVLRYADVNVEDQRNVLAGASSALAAPQRRKS